MFFINPFIYAAGADFESIATVTVGSGGASVTEFLDIPSGYQHLHIRGVLRNTQTVSGYQHALLRLNADSGNNYVTHWLEGNGSTAGAAYTAATSSAFIRSCSPRANATASVYGAFTIDILDYGSTSKNKVVRYMSGLDLNGSGEIIVGSNLYLSTSAVTSLALRPEANNFAQHSTFALYGIKAP